MNVLEDTTTRSLVALALAALVVASATPVTMAAGSIDTSNTDATTTVSDLTNGSTIKHDANESDAYRVQAIITNSTTPEMRVVLNNSSHTDDGTVVHRNTSMSNITAGSEGSHWNGTVTEGDLADVPIKANGTQTLDIEVYNASNTSDVRASLTVTLNETANRSVIYLGDSTANSDDDITTVNDSRAVFGLTVPYSTNDYSKVSRTVDTSAAESVTIVYANDTLADDYSSTVASNADAGDWIVAAPAAVDGNPIKVYNEEAPDDASSSSTYGVLSDIGGESGTTYHLGDDVNGTVELSAAGGTGIDFRTLGVGFTTILRTNTFSATDAIRAAY